MHFITWFLKDMGSMGSSAAKEIDDSRMKRRMMLVKVVALIIRWQSFRNLEWLRIEIGKASAFITLYILPSRAVNITGELQALLVQKLLFRAYTPPPSDYLLLMYWKLIQMLFCGNSLAYTDIMHSPISATRNIPNNVW